MKREIKERLADIVQQAGATTLQSIACPSCGGGISAQFVPAGGSGKGAGALSLMCPRCMWRVISDGIPAEPPWVRELGPKVQTTEKLVEKTKR